MKKSIILILLVFILVLSSCMMMPKNIKAVENFNLDKYLGKWYEIARMDFVYEKNLNNTTAEYSLNDDGSVKVVNKGFDTVKQEWKVANGKAKFRANTDVGELKVSFFGPFYSGYNVVALSDDYAHALIFGASLKYMWLLSRTPDIPDSVKKHFLNIASQTGYRIENLVWVEHDK